MLCSTSNFGNTKSILVYNLVYKLCKKEHFVDSLSKKTSINTLEPIDFSIIYEYEAPVEFTCYLDMQKFRAMYNLVLHPRNQEWNEIEDISMWLKMNPRTAMYEVIDNFDNMLSSLVLNIRSVE